jgi:hypothetical protein
MSHPLPPVAILIAHRVADYTLWKKAFDAHQKARQEAGCMGHHINRGADDPNMVYIYCPATDAAKLKGFVGDPNLARVMKDAGVQGSPTITLMTPMSADFIPDRKLPGIIVSHDVRDYDAWRIVYDGLDGYRKQNGIVGHAVNQQLGTPNRVIVYHQAEQPGTLRTFVASTELKEAMQRGGVAGRPDIQFVQVADIGAY